MDFLRKAGEAYSNLNDRLSWKSALLCAGVTGAAYSVYSFAVKPYLSPLRKIPGPDYGPVFGNVREAMVGEAMQTSISWIKKYGGIVRFYHLFGRERVLVADPEGLRHILVTNVDNYVRPQVNNIRIGSGIFTVSGEEHKLQRRLLNPFFNSQHIQSYLHIFEEKAAHLMSLWRQQLMQDEEALLNVQDDLMRMTLDVIGKAVFGYEFNSLENPESEANKAFRVITGAQNISFTSLIPFWDYLPTKTNRTFNWGFRVIDDIIYSIIAEKRKLLATDGGEEQASKDLLGKLMCVTDPETGRGFSDRELRDQVLSLLVAGHETTGSAMSWILLLLAEHQDVQDKVRTEAQTHLPHIGEGVRWEHIDRMQYTQAMIKEGQRLYPSAPSFYRVAAGDDTLCGYFIPKGTVIAYHVGAMMRNPAVWEEPDRFIPERFVEGSDRHLYTHLPFITGPHTCLGQQFARMQMRTIIPSLVKEFKFRLKPGMSFVRKLRVTLKAYPSVKLLASPA